MRNIIISLLVLCTVFGFCSCNPETAEVNDEYTLVCETYENTDGDMVLHVYKDHTVGEDETFIIGIALHNEVPFFIANPQKKSTSSWEGTKYTRGVEDPGVATVIFGGYTKGEEIESLIIDGIDKADSLTRKFPLANAGLYGTTSQTRENVFKNETTGDIIKIQYKGTSRDIFFLDIVKLELTPYGEETITVVNPVITVSESLICSYERNGVKISLVGSGDTFDVEYTVNGTTKALTGLALDLSLSDPF